MTDICNDQHQAQVRESFFSSLTGAAARVWNLARIRLCKRMAQRVNRQAFSHLLRLDDTLLADIGVTRDDVRWASKLPVDVNAALELDAIRKAAKKKSRSMRVFTGAPRNEAIFHSRRRGNPKSNLT